MNKNNIQAAAFFMLISVTGFSIMDLSVKWTTASYPIGEVIFFRMIFGIIPLIFVVPKERWKNLFETKKPGLHFIRCLTGTCALFAVYASLHYLPLAQTVSLTFASPIFSTILSIIILHEVVRMRRWLAIILGFIGVCVLVNPFSTDFTVYMFLPLTFCFFFAMVSISIRKLSETEPTYLVALYFTIFGIIASLVTPLKYLSLIYAIIFGYLIWGEVPTWNTYLGAALIVISSLIIIRRETVLKKSIRPETLAVNR
jgi:drug/metabolite transporter (DMT)-like permease